MKSIYFEKDDILHIRGSDKTIVREVSEGWHTNDKATDSQHIHLADLASAEPDEVRGGVVLDFDSSGALHGIDVQHASEPARAQPNCRCRP